MDYWHKQAQEVLVGKQVVKVSYLTDKEQEKLGWYKKPIVIELDNGTLLIPQMDDEGNDGGALAYIINNEYNVIPVI
jgi:hypothetical protein